MSHFSKIRVKIKEKSFLIEALKTLGYDVSEGNQICRGYQGNKVNVDFLIKRSNGYDIGFLEKNGSFELIADWYGIKNISEIELKNKLTQMYSISVTKAELKKKRFSILEEKLPNGKVRLIAKRLA